MLSVKPSEKPQAELQVPKSPLGLSTVPGQNTNNNVPPSPRSGGEGLDQWFSELQKYEATLGAMAHASEDPKFREELGTIEQWFKLLNESEQTASLYTLLQHANPSQIKFMSAVLSQMSRSIEPAAAAAAETGPKAKQPPRGLRPPSLNLPLPGSPATPSFNTPAPVAQDTDKGKDGEQEVLVKPKEETSWASMVNTPFTPMFQKGATTTNNNNGIPAAGPSGAPMNPAMMPGMPMLNPFNMAMLNSMGFSNEAQLLAVQMVMSGLIQPPQMPGQKMPGQQRQNKSNASGSSSWRSPASAKYPGSALRSGGFKSAGLKSTGPRSSGLKSASLGSAGVTPKDEDSIDPKLLEDVPAWLKSLRLHKYTHCFEGMTWQDMVVLDEPTLETKGVVALGARRRLTRTFDLVKKKMGMESDMATPTGPPASALVPPTISIPAVSNAAMNGPHSAAPTL